MVPTTDRDHSALVGTKAAISDMGRVAHVLAKLCSCHQRNVSYKMAVSILMWQLWTVIVVEDVAMLSGPHYYYWHFNV